MVGLSVGWLVEAEEQATNRLLLLAMTATFNPEIDVAEAEEAFGPRTIKEIDQVFSNSKFKGSYVDRPNLITGFVIYPTSLIMTDIHFIRRSNSLEI